MIPKSTAKSTALESRRVGGHPWGERWFDELVILVRPKTYVANGVLDACEIACDDACVAEYESIDGEYYRADNAARNIEVAKLTLHWTLRH